MTTTRTYVFQPGVKPSMEISSRRMFDRDAIAMDQTPTQDAREVYPVSTILGVTHRDVYQQDDGRWVVRWTFDVPHDNVETKKGVVL